MVKVNEEERQLLEEISDALRAMQREGQGRLTRFLARVTTATSKAFDVAPDRALPWARVGAHLTRIQDELDAGEEYVWSLLAEEAQ